MLPCETRAGQQIGNFGGAPGVPDLPARRRARGGVGPRTERGTACWRWRRVTGPGRRRARGAKSAACSRGASAVAVCLQPRTTPPPLRILRSARKIRYWTANTAGRPVLRIFASARVPGGSGHFTAVASAARGDRDWRCPLSRPTRSRFSCLARQGPPQQRRLALAWRLAGAGRGRARILAGR